MASKFSLGIGLPSTDAGINSVPVVLSSDSPNSVVATRNPNFPVKLGNAPLQSLADRLYSTFVSAPSVRPVDYITGFRVLSVSTNWLLGIVAGSGLTLSKVSKATYATSAITMAAFPNVSGTDQIQEVVKVSEYSILVEVGTSSVNNVVYKVVTKDNWVTATFVPWLYIGADNPTTGIGGNARGTVGYRLLSKNNVAFDSNGDVYVGEYIATATALGQRIRILKLAQGSTAWQIIWSLNVGASEQQIRHIHCCQINPYTGELWIGTGDYDSWNSGTSGAVARDQSWVLVWDKTVDLPNSSIYNTSASMVAQLRSMAGYGVRILSGGQATRPVQFSFLSSGVYYFSDASPFQVESQLNSGVFFVNHSGTTLKRVYGVTDESQSISGYYAVQTNSGATVFFPAAADTATFTTTTVPILTTLDGVDFAVAGQIQKVPNSISIPYGPVYDPDTGLVMVSYDNVVGKANTLNTIIFRVLEDTPHNKIAWDGTKIIVQPEILHPVYWVDVANSSGTALDAIGPQGHSPRTPWASISYAMSASRMTSGGRLKVLDTALTQTSALTSLAWNANAIPGDSSLPLELDLRGCTFAWNTNGYWLGWTATQHLRVLADYLSLGASVTTGGGFINNSAVAGDSNITFQDSRIGYLDHTPGITGGRIGFIGRGTVKLDRCRVMMASNGEVFQNSAGSTGKSIIQIYDSVIDEIATIVNDQRTDTDYDYQYSFAYARNRPFALNNAAAATGAFRIKTSAIATGASSGNFLFNGSGKPAAFAQDPFNSCVVNYDWTSSIDSIPITAPEWFVTNVKSAAPFSYEKTGYIPRNPGEGDWRDERYSWVGPRILVPSDIWVGRA